MSEDTGSVSAMVADQLDRLLSSRVNAEALANSETAGLDRGFWDAVAELGVAQLLVGEEQGGAGVGWSGVEGIVRLLGYHAAPAPIAETMLAAELLTVAGLDLPSGAIAVASGTARLDKGRLIGDVGSVAWLGQTDWLLLAATEASDRRLVLLPARDLKIQKQQTIGRIPGASAVLDGLSPDLAAPLPAGLEPLPRLAILRSLQMAGALERVLELSVDYAGTREQFGRPIAKFQAVQHLLAQLAEEVAAAQVAALFGARLVDEGRETRGAAIAKTRSGLSATRGAALAHQIFGAIGVTAEHPLHFFTRRLWQWRAEAGSEHHWAEWLGRDAIRAGGGALWPEIAGR